MNKSKRIFIIADIGYNPVKMYLNAMRKFAKGWIRLGHDVEIFSYRSAIFNFSPIKSKKFAYRFYKSKVDQLLAKQLKNYLPDIVFIGFPRIFDSESLQCIKQAAPNAVFVGHDVDPWPKLQKSNKIKTAKQLDVLLATNDGQFLQDYRDTGIKLCAFMPNACDPDIDHRYEIEPKFKSDILWVGAAKHSADSSETFREELVTKLAEQKNATLYGCLGRPKIGGIDYLYAISGARIGVNVNAYKSVKFCHSDRLTQHLACGTFVMAKRFEGCDLLYKDKVHLRYFDTIEEFFELSKWYLEHEQERKKIADAGMKHVHTEFNCEKISAYILELIDKGHYNAPWFQ